MPLEVLTLTEMLFSNRCDSYCARPSPIHQSGRSKAACRALERSPGDEQA